MRVKDCQKKINRRNQNTKQKHPRLKQNRGHKKLTTVVGTRNVVGFLRHRKPSELESQAPVGCLPSHCGDALDGSEQPPPKVNTTGPNTGVKLTLK